MAFFVSVVDVLSLCFVKYDLSLCVGLCATLILNGRSSLAVISDRIISISHFRIEQKTGSSRLFGGTKINNMPNMASRKFSYIPKVLCAA